MGRYIKKQKPIYNPPHMPEGILNQLRFLDSIRKETTNKDVYDMIIKFFNLSNKDILEININKNRKWKGIR